MVVLFFYLTLMQADKQNSTELSECIEVIKSLVGLISEEKSHNNFTVWAVTPFYIGL